MIADDLKSRRRRRRFFPQEVLDQTRDSPSSNDEKAKSDTNLTASLQLTSPSTISRSNRKSELSIHMENARKGITPSYSEMGKYKKTPTNSKDRFGQSESDKDLSYSKSNKENTRKRPSLTDIKTSRTQINSDEKGTKSIAKKMEELSALTKEALARVERLATKNRESPTPIGRPSSNSPLKLDTRHKATHSILKKKSFEEPRVVERTATNTLPVSILKRKVSQDDGAAITSTHTPPVTFSPSVVEPATTNRKQGILKKRRSLDESQVMRHRSCSPDVEAKSPGSILKNQRRSSLEELPRAESPELHGMWTYLSFCLIIYIIGFCARYFETEIV